MTTPSDVAPVQPPALLNPLASPEQARTTPSRQDGVPERLEDDLRAWGAATIQRMGCILELPQRVTATAQVLYQRFWFVTSLRQVSASDVAASCLFLATKVEEYPIRLRDLLNVYDYLTQADRWQMKQAGGGWWSRNKSPELSQSSSKANNHGIKSDAASVDSVDVRPFKWQPHSYQSSVYYELRDSLVVHEMQILKRLGFQLEAQLPYSTLINYLNILELGKERAIVQRCWSICTDMLQTSLPALFPPHVLAVASIYYVSLEEPSAAASASLPMALPQEPHPWYTLLDVSLAELQAVCHLLARLYDDQTGTASRVRAEWGGCFEMSRKDAVRQWLDENAQPLSGHTTAA